MDRNETGRVTIPTDVDMVPQTLNVLKLWGADAIRDCDGTEFPAELADTGAKIYATYYTTRKDNAWAKAHPEEIQQMLCYDGILHGSGRAQLSIPLLNGICIRILLQVNDRDDITRWWEVMDRTVGRSRFRRMRGP